MYTIYERLYHVNANYLGVRTILGFLVEMCALMFSSLIYVVVQCGDPGKPPNGQQLVKKGFVYGGSVTFICDKDYTLRGTFAIFCQENKEWTASVPRCLGKCL